MNAILKDLVTSSRARASGLSAVAKASPRRARKRRASLRDAIAGKSKLSCIAEFKRRSPSDPNLAPAVDLREQIETYVQMGVDALSVLTEPTRFGGAYGDLVTAARICELPILMKDFIVDARQIDVAAELGASAVLLIVRCFEDLGELHKLVQAADARGLEVLMECHDSADLEVAAGFDDVMIGVNNRDLDTMDVDIRRAQKLLPSLASDRVVVAESGYRTRADLGTVAGLADAALVGTSLMTGELRACDPR